jgi:hypothetical protein
MKINWKKIFNPDNIDFEKARSMSEDELWEYTKEIWLGQIAKWWIKFTYLSHYLNMTGYWQYILAIWMMRLS